MINSPIKTLPFDIFILPLEHANQYLPYFESSHYDTKNNVHFYEDYMTFRVVLNFKLLNAYSAALGNFEQQDSPDLFEQTKMFDKGIMASIKRFDPTWSQWVSLFYDFFPDEGQFRFYSLSDDVVVSRFQYFT